MDGRNIFREELAIRYPDYGHALWEPDPQDQYEAVAVGDVGFIHKGYFQRLFNALSPPPDSDSPDGAKYPPRLQPKNPRHLRKSRDSQKAFLSEKVAKLSHQSNVYASGPDDVTFSCSGTRGALSYLPFPADREETSAHGDFRKWMLKYIDDCFKIAEAFGCGVNHMEDIILVTGRHLARSWINVAFSGSSGGGQVSFEVQVTRDLHIRLEERDVSGAVFRLGPSGESLPENQCIFVQGYHVVRILNFWPRIRAAALDSDDDMHDPEPESGSDTHLEVVGIPSEADYRDPIHVLFEYIAEQAFNCDMILVHDNDLGFISGALPSDTLSEYIRNHAPVIQQVQYELFPRNESRSRTEESIVTVATLSRDLFEAPCQIQNNLECFQLMDTTNGSDTEISQFVFQENATPQSSDPSRSKYVSLTDDDLSHDGAIPPPTVSPHNVLPDPDRLQGSSVSSPQSDSRMDIPVSSLIEPTNRPSSMSQTIPSSTPTQSISNFTLSSIRETRASEEPGHMKQGSSDEDTRPVGDVENASSMTATSNEHIARHLSAQLDAVGSSEPHGVSGSNTTESGAEIAHDLEHVRSHRSRGISIAPDGLGQSALLDTSSHPTSSNVLPPVNGPNDLFIDGFLANTFSPQDAHHLFVLLLRNLNFQQYRVSYAHAQRSWYIVGSVPSPSLGAPSQNVSLPLDFSIKTTQGTVVPQRRWTPANEVDIRRHVEEARLQLPVFFVSRNGTLGFLLSDILQGRDHDLRDRDSQASLGGTSATTHIRINWPGYACWRRQIPTRDETYSRNPITVGRFMRHVGLSVNNFMNHCSTNGPGADPRWNIGPHGITPHHVKVIGAVHVSAGSWQPIIQLTGFVL